MLRAHPDSPFYIARHRFFGLAGHTVNVPEALEMFKGYIMTGKNEALLEEARYFVDAYGNNGSIENTPRAACIETLREYGYSDTTVRYNRHLLATAAATSGYDLVIALVNTATVINGIDEPIALINNYYLTSNIVYAKNAAERGHYDAACMYGIVQNTTIHTRLCIIEYCCSIKTHHHNYSGYISRTIDAVRYASDARDIFHAGKLFTLFGIDEIPANSIAYKCMKYYRTCTNNARMALYTWMLISRRLPIHKDIRKVIGMHLWEHRNQWEPISLSDAEGVV